ncbi:kinetochore scaffold 1 [Syngnathus scovelli]|uniref:kinetochore scaffold 1 n=1 Tax=Syngnathus scovelli TaxID=161590 RepID=UPI0035CC740E
MEPLHSDKNDENSGGSYRRRISSILKTPRKSAKFPDPNQQEKEVECAKPVDKRNSRRVTFALANDVLLYSKDAKNASLVRSPFQELMSAASVPGENSAQVSVSEDGIHQKMGMDPLIGAPLHVYEQKGNANIEPGEVFGEKTVTFSGEDSFMEMTQSQTINITGHQDYLVGASQNNRTLLSCGKKTAMSSGDGKSMKLSLGHGANGFDPFFNNLLARLPSPYGSNVEPDETTLDMSQITTGDVDKENQDPTLVHSEMGTIGLCQDEESKMDMTVSHTGHIAGSIDDADDPFRCFFPQQEMYSQSGTASQASPTTKTLQKHTRITLGSPNLEDTFKKQSTEKKMIFTAEDACMDMTDANLDNFFHEEKSALFASSMEKKRVTTGQSASSEKNVDPKFEEFLAKVFKTNGTQVNPGHSGMAQINPLAKATEEPCNGSPIHPKDNLTIDMTEFQRCDIQRCLPAQVRHPKGRQTAFHQLFPDNLPTSDERTVRFTANDGTMDMTQSLTVNIDTPFEPGTLKNTGGENTVIKFSANDVAMDVTQSLTSVIDTQLEPEVPKSIRGVPAGEEKTIRFSGNDTAMDMTQVIDTPFEPEAHHNTRKEKLVRYSSNGVEMDVTGNLTANIATYLELGAPHNKPTKKEGTIQFSAKHDAMDMTQSLTSVIDTQSEPEVPKNVHRVPAGEETTIRFSANDAAMDITQSLTAAIDTRLEPEVPKNIRRVPAGEEKMIRFSANDAAMDMTQSLTAAIDTQLEPEVPKNVYRVPAGEEKTIRFSANDAAMDMTQSLTAAIDTQLEPEVPKNIRRVPAGEEQAIRFSATDAAMEMTQSLTAAIDTQLKPEVPKNICRVPAGEEKTIRFSANDAAMDMTQSLTAAIDTRLEPQVPKTVHRVPAGEDITIQFSANDAAMDVTQSLTAAIDIQLKPEIPKNIRRVPAEEEKMIRFSANDAAMDMTQSLTSVIDTQREPEVPKNICHVPAGEEKMIRFSANDAAMDMTQSLTSVIDTQREPDVPKSIHRVPAGEEQAIRFSATDAAMEMTQSLTAAIDTQLKPEVPKNIRRVPAGEEQAIRFSATDAVMEMTQSLTAAIDTQLKPEVPKNIRRVSAGEEKTIRFSANDAVMDMTQSLTAAIDTRLEPEVPKTVHRVPAREEKTIQFSGNDVTMDVTQSLTAAIDIQLEPEIPQNIRRVPAGEEKMIRFSANDAAMDMTQSLTSVIDTQGEPEVPKNICHVPAGEEKMIRFSANDAAMDMTQSLTSVIDTRLEPEVPRNIHRVPAGEEKIIRFSANDAAMDMTQSLTSVIDTQSEPEVPKNIHHVPAREEKTIRFSANDAAMDMTQSLPTRFETSQDAVESPDPVNSEETQNSKEAELRNKTSPLSQKLSSPSTTDHGRHSSPSRKSRRSSIADLQLKLRRLSHKMTSEVILPDSTAFLPNLDSDADKSTKYNNDLPVSEFVPDIKTGSGNVEDSETQSGPQGTAIVGSPFAFKTTELMSTLSTGGFKQKLPQRKTRSNQSNSQEKSVSWTKIDNIVDKLKTWNDGDVRNICDEELVSCDESFQILYDKSPPKENSFIMEEFSIDEVFLNNVLQENTPDGVQGTKRCLASDEHDTENKKKMKSSSVMFPETVATEIQAQVLEIDHRADTTTIPSSSNHTMDSSSSTRSNISSCDATFNPTFKHSMMESHLEDREVQKLKDGSITVLEFLRLFNIDFVIHEPRQSILPDKFPHTTGCSAMDVLKNRHVYHPKKTVYEADFNNLSEKVERLNYRMLDKNKSLKVINYQLWDDLKDWTEKEIKSFGVKLKERHNFYRKMSKIHRHEMKEVLYSNLVQTLKDEQQKFKSTIESNEMIKILDDCICDLEAELAAVEDKGGEDMPSLKSLQEEMIKVNEALDDKNRQICELELEKTQASGKLVKLKAETKNLQSFIGVLEKLTEWRVREKTETHTLYTFLYDTLRLQLVHAGAEPDRKTSRINFKFVLDDEKSQSHARITHKLLSQHIEFETAWVEKYPTNSHIPKLLHDLSLVVSTCRLLGEELRLLKMWGGSRLNIVDVSCQDTRVNIVFSSLRRRSRFEVVLSVSLAKQCYVLHVHSFRNFFGDARAEQIDQILKSFSTGRNLLTKTIKKINCDLLC